MISLMAGSAAAALVESPSLSSLWSSLATALLSAPFALFLEFCFGRGMIFRKYRALVGYWLQYKPRARRFRVYTYLHKSGVLVVTRPRWYSVFFKPLGGCVYCFGSWIAVAFYFAAGSGSGILGLLGALGWNFLFIDIYQKFKSE